MQDIPENSVDLILCDLPYGTTACKWDNIIPFEPLWEQYNRIIKSNGAICLFGSEPFSTKLRMSNFKKYRYDWIWEKEQGTNQLLCKKRPLKKHEVISVFYEKLPTYNPQMASGKPYRNIGNKNAVYDPIIDKNIKRIDIINKGERYPTTILKFNRELKKRLHPTQKPVPLLEYLIKTYTNEADTVLDNCMGSGSTGVAAVNTKRRFIGIEKDDKYFELAKQRIENAAFSLQ